ncbi:MAG: molybdopterin molybdotransferase MoeA [Dehalococcoidales bacterium]|nr:molybdopterin molybdotransferase MoeA [Dehalococcoidales bacterium]
MGFDLVEDRGEPQLISVEEALVTILTRIDCLESEERPLLDSLGQVAAEDILSEINIPAWESSSRDGFALQASDTVNASRQRPRILKVTGTIAAGSSTPYSVTGGTAVRIMTGAPLPSGADCVVQFEDTDDDMRRRQKPGRSHNEIRIFVEGQAGQNINNAGETVSQGCLVVQKGSILGPADLGTLASTGLTSIRVIRRPVAAIIPTGDELVEPGNPLSPSGIYSSHSLAIAAQVKRCGGIPRILAIAGDNRRSLFSRVRQGLKNDLIITCGGSSAGDFDLVNQAMIEMGEVIFRRVNMAPGRPFSFGRLRKNGLATAESPVPLFALAGNPSAGMVNFEVLVRPAILKMQGKAGIFPDIIEAVMKDPFKNKKKARCYLWAVINKEGNTFVAATGRNSGEGILPSIAASNGMVIIPEDKSAINSGDKVQAVLLDWK